VAADYAVLAARFGLAEPAARQLHALAQQIGQREDAPTTVRDPQAVHDDHLADSLVALELEEVRTARAIVDLGAGGGFPGLPLAIALPHAEVRLLEANGRKCAFVAELAQALALANVRVVNARAESWPAGLGGHDLVTARALAPLNVVAEYAAPLLKVGGYLVAWRGQREVEVEAQAARAATVLGLSEGYVRQVFPYPGAAHRHLHVMSKVSPTPDGFPRRPGMARKRPLGQTV
jgi:16S rRNA (guanine527-N7)-methyltransferase